MIWGVGVRRETSFFRNLPEAARRAARDGKGVEGYRASGMKRPTYGMIGAIA